jgi:hypothetical protein
MSLTFNKSTYLASGSSARILHKGQCSVVEIIATTSSTNAQSVTLYDNETTSGNVLLKLNVVLTSPILVRFPLDRPLRCNRGLSVDPGSCDVQIAYTS